MISIPDLRTAWEAITPQAGQNIGRRADKDHPLDFFITYDEYHNRQLMLVSKGLPQIPNSSKQILVRANLRNDDKYALCFSLVDETLKEQFVSLCWDIMQCTYNTENEKVGVRTAVNRFCMWQKLFAEVKNKKLSDAEIKGLIGELCVLKEVVLVDYMPHDALVSWVGPLGADRDFEVPLTWYEVKAVSLSKDTVAISSLDQLDIDTIGELVIARIEKTSPNTEGAFSLNSLVDEIRNGLCDQNDRAIFDAKIASAKYDHSDARADESYFLQRIERYIVDKNFPRIRRSQVPDSISNGTYNLSIPGLQNWKRK